MVRVLEKKVYVYGLERLERGRNRGTGAVLLVAGISYDQLGTPAFSLVVPMPSLRRCDMNGISF